MAKPNQSPSELQPSVSARARRTREIEASQEALRRSIAESRRLIEQAAAIARRNKRDDAS